MLEQKRYLHLTDTSSHFNQTTREEGVSDVPQQEGPTQMCVSDPSIQLSEPDLYDKKVQELEREGTVKSYVLVFITDTVTFTLGIVASFQPNISKRLLSMKDDDRPSGNYRKFIVEK